MSGSTEEKRAKAVSLFSGLGGIDIGLHRAGVETVACIERDVDAAKTLKINSKKHPDKPDHDQISVPENFPWRVIDSDIRNIDSDDILDECDTSRDDIDIVVGGPPCQTFSRSNEGSRSGTESERGKLYEEYAKILHQVEPEAFIFENVRGLRSANDGEDLEAIREELEGDTYETECEVLNAAKFGVPQARKRILIVGTKSDTNFDFPKPTHTKDGCGDAEEWISAEKALQEFDVDESIEEKGGYQNAIGSKYGPLLKDIPEGANYQHFSERKYDTDQEEYVERSESELEEKVFDWRTRHWNYLLKLDQQRPSWTLQAAPGTTVGPFHWRARKLSLLEQMKLMTIPLDYYIAGTPNKIQQQIGNAVPPRFVKVVTDQLLELLDLNPSSDTEMNYQTTATETTTVEKKPPFTIEISTDNSPWCYADKLLRAMHAEDSAVIQAGKQAIPYAIDTLEITKRQISCDLSIEITEEVIQDKNLKGGVCSNLEAKIMTG